MAAVHFEDSGDKGVRIKTSIALVAGAFIGAFLMIIPPSVISILYGQTPSWWWNDVNPHFARIFGALAIIAVVGLSHLVYRIANKITPWVSRQLDSPNLAAQSGASENISKIGLTVEEIVQ
mgnify:CR=1 FL=1